jgi:hypothetical protein
MLSSVATASPSLLIILTELKYCGSLFGRLKICNDAEEFVPLRAYYLLNLDLWHTNTLMMSYKIV